MLYAEAAYFDGAHVAHIAAYYDHLRFARITRQAREAVERARPGVFRVYRMMDNSRTRIIGYQVMSASKLGGMRQHFNVQAQHTYSLERAYARCAKEADRLQVEADRNRARG